MCKALLKRNIESLQDFSTFVYNAYVITGFHPDLQPTELIWDFKSWLQPFMRNIVGHSQPLFFMFDKDPQQPSSLLIHYQLDLDSPLSEPLDLMEGFPDYSISFPPLVQRQSIDNDILGNTRSALPYLLPTAQLQICANIWISIMFTIIPFVGQIMAVFTDSSSGDIF
ncbi:hypothetical protein QOT17_020778 [Balamuthia mandrillaris]